MHGTRFKMFLRLVLEKDRESFGLEFKPCKSNLFRTIQKSVLEPFRIIPKSISERFRILPIQSGSRFISRSMQTGWKSVRINSNHFEIAFNRLYSNSFGLSRIDFHSINIERDSKCYSDSFRIIRIEIYSERIDLFRINSKND